MNHSSCLVAHLKHHAACNNERIEAPQMSLSTKSWLLLTLGAHSPYVLLYSVHS